ncbi:MAG TPA: SRPBCC family protein [Frankiaceae bacterium]|nr:SRPBCC family protein [Frankiaceae bacterium]
MRLSEKRRIKADRETVWAWVCDPARYPEFMDGVDRWRVQGDHPSGCGARWDVRMKIGAAPVGGIVEVIEFEEPGDLAWNSVTGVTMRGRWRLRERGEGETEVTLRLAYQAPGGLMGLIADRVAEPIVRRSLKRSLRNLQMLVESRPAPTKTEGPRRSRAASGQADVEPEKPRKATKKATKAARPAKNATKAARPAKKATKASGGGQRSANAS